MKVLEQFDAFGRRDPENLDGIFVALRHLVTVDPYRGYGRRKQQHDNCHCPRPQANALGLEAIFFKNQ